MKKSKFGKKIGEILLEVEDIIIDFNADSGEKPNYSKEGFRAATSIFMSAFMDKLYELQEDEKMDLDVREKMADAAGNELRNLIKKYTDIDTHKLF